MSESTRSLEVRVGIFVLIGMAVIAFMAVQFGRLGQGLTKYYTVTVELPNAGGILKGSDVLLAGARIGHVSTKPQIAGSIDLVRVELSIVEEIKLPRAVTFQVGSSGLLGDRFIEVTLPRGFEATKFDSNDASKVLQPGTVVRGVKAGAGLSELAEKGGEAMEDVKASLARIQELTQRISTGVLSEQNLENMRVTFANLKTTSEQFASASAKVNQASDKINTVLDDAKSAVNRAGDTMKTADAAANDLRAAINDARKVVNSAGAAVSNARSGNGLLANLLTNAELAENLQALVRNLRRHGVLFYKDSAARLAPTTVPAPGPVARPTRPPRRE